MSEVAGTAAPAASAASAASAAVTFTVEQVRASLNKACNDIVEAAGAPEDGLRDGLNLLVNATAYYLENADATLEDVAYCNYAEPLETILEWIG